MLKDFRWNLPEDFFIEFFLFFLVLFPPVIYGSITIFPLSLIEATAFLVFFIFFVRPLISPSKTSISFVRIPAIPLLLFISLLIFQLLPLSKDILSFISPSTARLYRDFSIPSYGNFTLSIYNEASINILLQFITYLIVFFITLNYIDSEKKARRLILTIVIWGFLCSLYGLLSRNLSVPTPHFATFTNHNHFVAYLAMVVFLCIGYSLANISKTIRVILLFMASVMILAIFLTSSRSGKVCLFISFLVFFFLLNIKRPLKQTIAIAVILILFFSLFVGMVGLEPLMLRMNSLSNPLGVYSSRLEIVKDSFEIFKDFPLWGTGLGTFSEIAQKYKMTNWQVTYVFSHNEPLQLLVEVGFIGFLLFFIFLFNFLKNIFSMYLKRHSPFAVYTTLGCLTGCFSMISLSFFDFMFHVPANSILFFIILALACRVAYIKEPQDLLPVPKSEFILPRFAGICFIVVSCALLVFSEVSIFRRYQAEVIFQKIKDKKISESGIKGVLIYKKALRQIDEAITLNSLKSSYFNRKADLLSDFALREDSKNELYGLGEFNKGPEELLDLAEDLYKKAIALNPTKADYHLRLGWLYGSQGKEKPMKNEFEKALLLDPQNAKIQSYVEGYLSTNPAKAP